MAEETISLPLSTFNLGIESSGAFGNLEDAEIFLSGEDNIKRLSDEERQAEEDKKKKKTPETTEEAPPKKKEAPKVQLGADEVFGEEDEDNEEEEDEDDAPPKKKTIKDAVEGGEEDENEDDNQFKTFSEAFYKSGVFIADDEENPEVANTEEEFIALSNKQAQKKGVMWIENFLSQFGDDYKDAFEALFVNGVEIKDYLSKFSQIQDFEGINLNEESNQEKVVREYYRRLKWTDTAIENRVSKLKNYADLEDEAKTVHPMMLEQDKEALQEMEEKKEKDRLSKEQSDKAYVQNLQKAFTEKLKDKNFDGIPLTQDKAEKAFKALHEKRFKLPNGELITEFDVMILESKKPENIANRIKIMLLAQENFNLSKIEKKAVAKESGSLFSNIKQKSDKKSNTQGTVKKPQSNWG